MIFKERYSLRNQKFYQRPNFSVQEEILMRVDILSRYDDDSTIGWKVRNDVQYSRNLFDLPTDLSH